MNDLIYQEGKRIFSYVKNRQSVWQFNWWTNKMLQLSLQHEDLKNQMFRFVDILPNLKTDKEITKYLAEYLDEANHALSDLIRVLSSLPFMHKTSAAAVKLAINMVAKTFIVASNVEEARRKLPAFKSAQSSYTLDILGEIAVGENESLKYLEAYLALINQIPETNVSVKLSAIYSQINSTAFEHSKKILKDRLRKIFRAAKANNSSVNVDLEHYDWKDLTYAVFKELLLEEEFLDWDAAGIVLQAYLKSSEADLLDLINWSKKRPVKILLRLVKGAYWDYETAIASQRIWEEPVFTDKAQADANYEKLLEILIDNHDQIKPAIASHNIRSVATAINLIKARGLKADDYEFQVLYGMVEQLRDYLIEEGHYVRSYLPYGDLILGMSYLVRRLLENTANESFLKQSFMDKESEDQLLRDPKLLIREKNKNSLEKEFFINEANKDFAQAQNREKLRFALQSKSFLTANKQYPLLIANQELLTEEKVSDINPSAKDEVLGYISQASIEHAESAVEAADKSFEFWSGLDVSLRADVLKLVADELRKQRFDFIALLVYEVGKPWHEADAEVSELIDFLEYYSAHALKLFSENKLISKTGEKNTGKYTPLGVATIISPWNFPLAIMGGMSAAALISGNTVIIKPSQQASLQAYRFTEIFRKALHEKLNSTKSIIDGIINFLPGRGSSIGDYLVKHPSVKLIAFTGSSEVGLSINQIANSIHEEGLNKTVIKRVIAETGGKNAIIVDNTADLDEAVPGTVYSAFAFSGQKCSACSRVIVLESIYDDFIHRLKEATESIYVRAAKEPEAYLGPVVDEASYKNALNYIEIGKTEGQMLVGNLLDKNLNIPKEQGYFISPTIFTGIKANSRLAQEEIFAPVLAVIKVKDLNEAIKVANNTVYGLTGGIYSRSPKNIKLASEKVEVGNFYINRACTGAIVGRQAFGGMKQSSIGFKAGGPNYLLQFVKEKTITENTMRRGFTIE